MNNPMGSLGTGGINNPTSNLNQNSQSNQSNFQNVRQIELNFQERLLFELKKVNNFAVMKHEDIFLTLRKICQNIENRIEAEKNVVVELMNGGSSSGTGSTSKKEKSSGTATSVAEKGSLLAKDSSSKNTDIDKTPNDDNLDSQMPDFETLKQQIRRQAQEIIHLDQFVRLNFSAFAKLTNKFDQCLQVSSGSIWFMGRLHNEAFCNINFDDILILLSLTWALYRECGKQIESTEKSREIFEKFGAKGLKDGAKLNKDAKWKPPESFVRKTQKYWVKYISSKSSNL